MSVFGFGKQRAPGIGRDRVPVLIQQQLPDLYRFARGVTGADSEAEDLVHDACVKALIAGETATFESENQFRTWLRRILINTYRDYYRRALRSPLRPLEYHAASDDSQNVVEMAPSTDLSPPESMQSEQSSTAIHNAFSTLPPEVRVVAVLFLVSGLSYQEIAAVTDCPIGTVMSRLGRGRKILRRELRDYCVDTTASLRNSGAGGDLT